MIWWFNGSVSGHRSIFHWKIYGFLSNCSCVVFVVDVVFIYFKIFFFIFRIFLFLADILEIFHSAHLSTNFVIFGLLLVDKGHDDDLLSIIFILFWNFSDTSRNNFELSTSSFSYLEQQSTDLKFVRVWKDFLDIFSSSFFSLFNILVEFGLFFTQPRLGII